MKFITYMLFLINILLILGEVNSQQVIATNSTQSNGQSPPVEKISESVIQYQQNPLLLPEDCRNLIGFLLEQNEDSIYKDIPNCCEKAEDTYWHFINCENGSITEIDLRFDVTKIQKKIDFSNFPKLNKLKSLAIEAKFLNDELPTIFFDFPELKKLEVSQSNIEKVPTNLNENNLIEEIVFYNDSLVGFPSKLLDYPNIKILDLSLNENIREVPKNIINLSNLTELYLQSTGLTELPKEIFSLSNLIEFDIDRNPQLNAIIRKFGNKIKNCDFRYTNIICYEPGTCENFCTGESNEDLREFVKEDAISYNICTKKMLEDSEKSFFQTKTFIILLVVVVLLIIIILSVLLIRSYHDKNKYKKNPLDHDIYVAPVIIKREPVVINNGDILSSDQSPNMYIPSINNINSRMSINSFISNDSTISPLSNNGAISPVNSPLSSYQSSPLSNSPTTSPRLNYYYNDNKHNTLPIYRQNDKNLPEYSLSETNRRSIALTPLNSNYYNNNTSIINKKSENQNKSDSNDKELESAIKDGELLDEHDVSNNENDKSLPPYSEPVGNPINNYQKNLPININNNQNNSNNNNNNNNNNNYNHNNDSKNNINISSNHDTTPNEIDLTNTINNNLHSSISDNMKLPSYSESVIQSQDNNILKTHTSYNTSNLSKSRSIQSLHDIANMYNSNQVNDSSSNNNSVPNKEINNENETSKSSK